MATATIVWLIAIGLGFIISTYKCLTQKSGYYNWKTLTIGIPYNLFLLGVLFPVGFSFASAVLGLIAIINIAIFVGNYGEEAEPLDGVGEYFFFILFNLGAAACALAL